MCESATRDVNTVHEEAKQSNTSYGYSGGTTTALARAEVWFGPMARLVASLEDAKRETDKVMTEVVKREKEEPPDKKPRLGG